MSRFLDMLLRSAAQSPRGMTTGEPRTAVRRSWNEVHQIARRIAADLVAEGLRPGTSVAVLAGEPAQIAPAAQATWLAGGSVTMLHQPTPRTDLAEWAEDTVR
ncbi:MAG TPA: long-chain fatty acid--CoA ligase, partial [Pseudonocardia sp.]